MPDNLTDVPVLYYKNLDGNVRAFSGLTPFTTVSTLKQIIEYETKVPSSKQVLSVWGIHILEDSELVSNIGTETTIRLGLRIIGGSSGANKSSRPINKVISQK